MHNIQALADEIRMNGYVILENMIPEETVSTWLATFDPMLDAKRASQDANRGANRFQMDIPFAAPFADPLLYANPVVLSILENLLGKDIICTYFASDTPFPGSDFQPVHLDCRLPFPESPNGMPVYSIVLNTPLVNFTEDNGPLELWPGATHLIPQPHSLEEMARKMPSVKPLMKAGDILLRDPRVWHRGTPNNGSRSRPNIALVYSRGWFRFENHPTRIKIPRAEYEGFSAPLKAMFRYCALLNEDGTISDVPYHQ
jgi:ectoine hydroxylase-related dioxygenase (phytanoyl-CoA dioxygenase family)